MKSKHVGNFSLLNNSSIISKNSRYIWWTMYWSINLLNPRICKISVIERFNKSATFFICSGKFEFLWECFYKINIKWIIIVQKLRVKRINIKMFSFSHFYLLHYPLQPLQHFCYNKYIMYDKEKKYKCTHCLVTKVLQLIKQSYTPRNLFHLKYIDKTIRHRF